MTKEELEKEAEKFIIEKYEINKCYAVDTEETRKYMSIDVHNDYEEEYQCYLAGLKAQQIQWHDLRKNSNDLPKEDTKLYLVYVYIWNGNYRKYGLYLPTICEWNKDWNRFESMDDGARGTSINIRNCYKWCELPKV